MPAKNALERAYLIALEKLSEAAGSHQFEINWALDGLRAKLNPVVLDEETLRKYVGDYGERRVTLKKGTLVYQRRGPAYQLIPISESLFAVEGLDDFRIQFAMGKDGTLSKLVGLLSDGYRDPAERSPDR